MKIVVTGGCGFIGSSFVNYLRQRKGHDRRYSINSNKLEMKMKTYRLTTKSLDKFLQERFG